MLPGQNLLVHWSSWATFACALIAAMLAVETARRVLRHRARSDRMPVLRAAVRRATWPAFACALLVAVRAALPQDAVHGDARSSWAHLLTCALIAAAAWFLLAASRSFNDVALQRLTPALEAADNRRARRTRTQLLIANRLLAVLVVVVAIAAVLLTFPSVRAVGASLLAGAGIIAAVLGVAGKSTLANLVAGVQLAFTDLLRLDDVVVVNDEWGRVDEIGLTFVVIRTWDERRVVLPSGWFTDNPFQNWTRDSSRVIGTVYARLDWRVPIEEVRAEVQRVLSASPLWDRRDWVVQVTELNVDHVEIRALMSAADAPSAWDLRCDVREQLVRFIRERHPEALPHTRVELAGPRMDDIPAEWSRLVDVPRS